MDSQTFFSWYQKDGGTRSYTRVKNRLQEARLVPKAKQRGRHRKHLERSPLPGMLLHQDGSTHEWVPGQYWDLIVTMDDATNEHYSMLFVEEEGTQSSFQGVLEVIESQGLFSAFYSDRGSHYWITPEARGRSERAFATHQGQLPKELALTGITDIVAANRYLHDVYRPSFNAEFVQQAQKQGSAFVPFLGGNLNDILCEQFERTVGKDNCVRFGLTSTFTQGSNKCPIFKY